MKKTLIAILAAALLLTALTPASFAEEGKKVLNWFIEGEVTTMDSSKVYDTLSGEAVAYFTDTLYRLDSEANAVPNLAVDLPQISEDGTVVTVTIRDDAKYADGTPVTAGDIEYAVKRAADPAVGSQATSLPAIKNLDAVRAGEAPLDELGVKALSDTVIEFTLDGADPYIAKKLADTIVAPISRAFAEEKGDQYGLSADTLLASGAYSLTNWTGADISWTYVKNPYYWDAENVYFDEINIQVVKDVATGTNLYESGKLDATFLTSDCVPLYAGTDDLLGVPTLRMTNLEMGISSNEFLQNENIRKALLFGLNREELCTNVLNGTAVPGVGVIPDGIATNPETGASVAEDFGGQVYFDPEAAKAYFAKGLEELGVDSITLRLVTSDTDESIKIGQYLQSAYETNLPGLKIDLANVPSSVRFEEMMSYDFDLALGGWTGDYDPTSYVNQHRSDYAHNHSQWQSDELAALIDKLNTEDGTDFATRWAHLGEANKYLLDNAVVIPLEQATKEFLVNPALKGYVTKQLGYGVFDLTRAYFEE